LFRRSPETKDEDSRTGTDRGNRRSSPVGACDRDPGMTTESILRISITAMVLLLVIAPAAAQTTSTPLYVDGVLRVVATFHRINERSLPVSGLRD
jgi:hypothetical protein